MMPPNVASPTSMATRGWNLDGALSFARMTSDVDVPSLQIPLPPIEFKVRLEDVEFCRRPDGSLWQLGSGGYGTGRAVTYAHVHACLGRVGVGVGVGATVRSVQGKGWD